MSNNLKLSALDRLREMPQRDVECLSTSELLALRDELQTEASNSFEIAKRIETTAAGRKMTPNQKRDFDTALKHAEEATELIPGVVLALRGKEVDYSKALTDTDGMFRDHLGNWSMAEGSTFAYGEGRALQGAQTMAGFVRSQGHVRHGEENLSLGKYLRGMVTGSWKDAENERRAMAEGTLSSGGYLVPTILSSEIIDKARNQAAVLSAGARLFPMASQTVDVAKWTGDPTPGWHSEAGTISPSDGTLGRVRLQAKALTGLTVLSRELLDDATGIDEQLAQAFAAQFALTIDKAALYGSGSAPEPLGIKNTSGITTLSMGTNGAALTNFDPLVDAVGTLRDSNERGVNGIIYSPRTERALGKLKDSTDQPLNAPEYLAGIARYSTNQIPNNVTQGTSSAASDMFTADWSQLLVGVRTDLQIQVLTERYADTGQVGILCWWRGDVAVARPAAFAITVGIL